MSIREIFSKYNHYISLVIIGLLFVGMGTFYVTEGITMRTPKFGKKQAESEKEDPCKLQIKELSKCREADRAKRILDDLGKKL
jgi:hypothetical protein